MNTEKNSTLILVLVAILVLVGYFYLKNRQSVSTDNMNGTTTQEVLGNGTQNEVPVRVSTSPANEKVEVLPSVTPDGIYLVYYSKDGFSPNVLQIRKGASVRFVNKSDEAMRVFSTNTEYIFSQLNQPKTVGKDGTYDFTFTQDGIWTYTNHNNPVHNASILVY